MGRARVPRHCPQPARPPAAALAAAASSTSAASADVGLGLGSTSHHCLLSWFFCRCKLPLILPPGRLGLTRCKLPLTLLPKSHVGKIFFAPGSCKFWCYSDLTGTSPLTQLPVEKASILRWKIPNFQVPWSQELTEPVIGKWLESPSQMSVCAPVGWLGSGMKRVGWQQTLSRT